MALSASIALTLFLFGLAWTEISSHSPLVYGTDQKVRSIEDDIADIKTDIREVKSDVKTLLSKP